jgi:hypothetical protein
MEALPCRRNTTGGASGGGNELGTRRGQALGWRKRLHLCPAFLRLRVQLKYCRRYRPRAQQLARDAPALSGQDRPWRLRRTVTLLHRKLEKPDCKRMASPSEGFVIVVEVFPSGLPLYTNAYAVHEEWVCEARQTKVHGQCGKSCSNFCGASRVIIQHAACQEREGIGPGREDLAATETRISDHLIGHHSSTQAIRRRDQFLCISRGHEPDTVRTCTS